MSKDRVMVLSDVIRQTSFDIHRYHRQGHLEKIYENALAHRLRKLNLNVQAQLPIAVHDEDGTLLGDMTADLFVEDCLLIELKACAGLRDEHIAQLLGYLRATRTEHGLLINFGTPKLQIRKFVLADIAPAAL